MNNKNLLIFLVLSIMYFSTLVYFYFEYSNSLDKYNSEIYFGLNSLQNLVHKLHNEESKLYKELFSNDLNEKKNKNYLSVKNNTSSDFINELLNLKETNKLSTSVLASTINDYYSLDKLRLRIIELNFDYIKKKDEKIRKELNFLIGNYESQINIILENINEEIELNKRKNKEIILGLKKRFFYTELFLLFIYFFSLLFIFYINKSFNNKVRESKFEKCVKNENLKLDKDLKRIIQFVEKEIRQGNFPSIKEIKKELKISHPTLLMKLKFLEKSKIISIKKKGRNKHIFLK